MQIGINLALTQRNGGAGAPALNIDFAGTGVLPSTVTFSRGTNATLTGSNGLIQYAPHNLLTNSEDFEAAAWTKVAATVTANAAVAPDGTTTADFLQEDTTTNTHNVALSVNFQAVPTTASVYVRKTSTRNAMIYMFTASGFAGGVLDVATGTSSVFAGSLAGTTTSVTDAGLYWRVSVTATMFALAGQVNVYAMNGSTASYTGNGTSGIFIWGAQLNVGSTAQSYNSTTPKNLLGFTQEPENAAWTKSNSYVQQNLLTWSQGFENSAWQKLPSGVAGTPVVTADVGAAPDGTVTADRVQLTLNGGTTSGDRALVAQSVTLVVSTTYTYSIWLRSRGASVSMGIGVDNVVGNTPITVTSSWQRFTVTGTATGTSGLAWFQLRGAQTPVQSDSADLEVWGAQLVQGSTAGDYTQTTSAAAPTRYLNWDGTLTGRKLVEDTAAATTHRILNSVGVTVPTNGAAANIVYAKAGERTAVRLTDNDIQGADFDLLTGAVSNIGSGVTAAATNVGGGWWRLSVIRTNSTGTGRVVLYLISGGTITYTGDGTSGIYVSDFQLSNSASVDPYIYNPQAAAASAAYYGPRFDYDPVTLAAKGLLIEEQRTNLLTYSQDFSNVTAWPPTNITVTNAATTAPDGTNTAQSIAATTTAATLLVSATATVSATSATYSVYAKQGTGANSANTFILRNNTTATNLLAGTLNYSTGAFTYTIGSTGVSVQNAGNGWWRLIMTVTSGVTAGDGLRGYVGFSGASETAGTFLYAWGAQLEAGAFSTSYIPTQASQVTRNADSASMLGDNFYTWYNPNQGTLYGEVTATSDPAGTYRTQVTIKDSGNTNFARFRLANLTPTTVSTNSQVMLSGVLQADLNSANIAIPSVLKTTLGFASNNFGASTNGATPLTDTSGSMPANPTLLEVTGGSFQVGQTYVRRIGYYNTRLPDSTLQALTV